MPLTTTLRSDRVIWRADDTKIARQGDRRTGCGQPIVAERLAWTAETKCPDCLTVFATTVRP